MLRLTRRSASPIPLEAPCLVPDRLAELTLKDIERLPVLHGNREEPLAEHFTVTGQPGVSLELNGDCSRVKWVAAGMTRGSVRVHSAIGTHAGSAMRAGELTIDGDADDWLAAEMRGGLVRVRGRAGDHAGAAYPGSRKGMRGGIILIEGPTGAGCAAVMRRGLIATGGCGEFAGASMVAGSLFVFGPLGRYAGAMMKRGTIVTTDASAELLPTFVESGVGEFVFLRLYARRLAELGEGRGSETIRARRYCGDLASLGLGEILRIES